MSDERRPGNSRLVYDKARRTIVKQETGADQEALRRIVEEGRRLRTQSLSDFATRYEQEDARAEWASWVAKYANVLLSALEDFLPPVNLPWERVPSCACDPGHGEPPSKLQRLECKARRGPCAAIHVYTSAETTPQDRP